MFEFDLDPEKPNRPDQPNLIQWTPFHRLTVMVNKQAVGLPYRTRTRRLVRLQLGVVDDETACQKLDELFPLWKRNVYYPPMETRVMLRQLCEATSADLVRQYGPPEQRGGQSKAQRAEQARKDRQAEQARKAKKAEQVERVEQSQQDEQARQAKKAELLERWRNWR